MTIESYGSLGSSHMLTARDSRMHGGGVLEPDLEYGTRCGVYLASLTYCATRVACWGLTGWEQLLFLSTEERRDCVLSVNAPCALSRAGVSCASVHEPEQSAPREQCDSVDEEMRRPHTLTRTREAEDGR